MHHSYRRVLQGDISLTKHNKELDKKLRENEQVKTSAERITNIQGLMIKILHTIL